MGEKAAHHAHKSDNGEERGKRKKEGYLPPKSQPTQNPSWNHPKLEEKRKKRRETPTYKHEILLLDPNIKPDYLVVVLYTRRYTIEAHKHSVLRPVSAMLLNCLKFCLLRS